MTKVFAVAILVLASGVPAMAGFSEVNSVVTPWSNGSGEHFRVNGTGIDLFEPATPFNPPYSTGIWSDNNTAPIAYPGESPAYVPSPGSYDNYWYAEQFDIEGILYHYNGLTGDITVWLVTSMGPDGTAAFGNYYGLGDVFLDVNPTTQPGYDYAFLSFGGKPGLAADHTVWNDGYGQHWSTSNSRSAGAVAPLVSGSTLYGINGPNSFAGYSSVMGVAGPWALNNPSGGTSNPLRYQEITGSRINSLDYASAHSGYSGAGSFPTYVYQWDGTLATGLDAGDFHFHAAFQCGNDFTDHATQVVPAPGALLLGALGVALVGVSRRRRVSWRR